MSTIYRLDGGGTEVWWREVRDGAAGPPGAPPAGPGRPTVREVEYRSRIERGWARGTAGVVETVRLVCGPDLRPRGFYAAVQAAGGWRTLEALPRADGWVAVVVAGPDGTRRRLALPLPPDAHVDYPSPLFAAVALARLALAAGESREVPVLRVESPSLEPSAGVLRWTRAPGAAAAPGGAPAGAAVRYRRTDPATGRSAEVWAAPDGTVLRFPGLAAREAGREAEG